eukprot:TRINITY_DN124126_c0_g1_i1.p1 TRINITY_DN124126_c0_g1~~TRINITY_DN124126_c0_g1_i1.p1  ORF type:complete len:568 (-),score=116.91 TRINITY_DN124126_c0_g1_i1:164-1867(-)
MWFTACELPTAVDQGLPSNGFDVTASQCLSVEDATSVTQRLQQQLAEQKRDARPVMAMTPAAQAAARRGHVVGYSCRGPASIPSSSDCSIGLMAGLAGQASPRGCRLSHGSRGRSSFASSVETDGRSVPDEACSSQMAELRRIFRCFEKAGPDGDKVILLGDLRVVLEFMGHSMSEANFEALVAEVDADGSGTLEFDEFLSMAIEIGGVRTNWLEQLSQARSGAATEADGRLTKAFLQKLFQHFESNGTINTADITKVLIAIGRQLSDEEVHGLIDAADEDGSGTLDFDEFVALVSELHKHTALRTQFDLYADKSGEVATDVVPRIMAVVGDFSDQEIVEAVKVADKDGSGMIDIGELLDLWTGLKSNVRLRKAFDDFMIDGEIRSADVARALVALGIAVTSRELREGVASADEDGSGTFDYEEFRQLVTTLRSSSTLRTVFAHHAKEGNVIQTSDVDALLREIGEVYEPEHLVEAITSADEDGSGALDFGEFQQLLVELQRAGQKTFVNCNSAYGDLPERPAFSDTIIDTRKALQTMIKELHKSESQAEKRLGVKGAQGKKSDKKA